MGQSGTGAEAGTPPGAEGGEDAPEIMATEVLMGGGKQSQEPESVHVKSSTSTSTPVVSEIISIRSLKSTRNRCSNYRFLKTLTRCALSADTFH